MLKLSQINLLDNDIIVKGFEPEVYTHIGDIAKSDETLQRDRSNAPHILAEIVRLGNTNLNPENHIKLPDYKIGMLVLINRFAGSQITIPIQGYKEKELAIINVYSIIAIITPDDAPPLMESL